MDVAVWGHGFDSRHGAESLRRVWGAAKRGGWGALRPRCTRRRRWQSAGRRWKWRIGEFGFRVRAPPSAWPAARSERRGANAVGPCIDSCSTSADLHRRRAKRTSTIRLFPKRDGMKRVQYKTAVTMAPRINGGMAEDQPRFFCLVTCARGLPVSLSACQAVVATRRTLQLRECMARLLFVRCPTAPGGCIVSTRMAAIVHVVHVRGATLCVLLALVAHESRRIDGSLVGMCDVDLRIRQRSAETDRGIGGQDSCVVVQGRHCTENAPVILLVGACTSVGGFSGSEAGWQLPSPPSLGPLCLQ